MNFKRTRSSGFWSHCVCRSQFKYLGILEIDNPSFSTLGSRWHVAWPEQSTTIVSKTLSESTKKYILNTYDQYLIGYIRECQKIFQTF